MAPDFRGHGCSGWDPAGRYDVERFTADVVELLNAIEFEQLVLVGHSLGGEIAARVAKAMPDCVDGMMLIDVGPGCSRGAVDTLKAQLIATFVPYESVDQYFAILRAQRPLPSDMTIDLMANASLRDAGGRYMLKSDPKIVDLIGPGDDDSAWWMRTLASYRFPVFVVRGIASAVFPNKCAVLATEMLRHGELRTVEAAGHAVVTDNPAGILRVMREFLDRTKGKMG